LRGLFGHQRGGTCEQQGNSQHVDEILHGSFSF
jgi:hypothetical protein